MKEIDTKQKFILQQCDDYVQSANTLFHFMQRQEYLSALLKRRALVPRYCQENIAYLSLEIGSGRQWHICQKRKTDAIGRAFLYPIWVRPIDTGDFA